MSSTEGEGGSDLESESQLVIATRLSIETMNFDAARFRQREADYQTGLHTALQESLEGDAALSVTEAQAEAQLQSDLSTAMLASLPACEGQGEHGCGSSSTDAPQILDEGYICESESSDGSFSDSDDESMDDQEAGSEDDDGLSVGPFSPPPKACKDPPCVSPAQPLCISFKPEHAQSGSFQKIRHPGRQKAVYPDGRNYRHAGVHHAKSPSPLFPKQLGLTDNSDSKLRKVRCDFDGSIEPGYMRKKCTFVSIEGQACGGCLFMYSNKGKLGTFINKKGEKYDGQDSSDLWYQSCHLSDCKGSDEQRSEFANALQVQSDVSSGVSARDAIAKQGRRIAKNDLGGGAPFKGAAPRTVQRKRKAEDESLFGQFGIRNGVPEIDNIKSLPNLVAFQEGNQGDLDLWNSKRKAGKGEPKTSGSEGSTNKSQYRRSKSKEHAKSPRRGKTRFFAATVAESFREEIESGKFEYAGVDATFCCHKKFQILNVVSKRSPDDPKQVVLFSILMCGRKYADYKRVWRAIRRVFPSFDPTCFSADFERALRRSFMAIFSRAVYAACLFHFKQSMKRALKKRNVPASVSSYLKSALTDLCMAPTTARFRLMMASLLSELGAGKPVAGKPVLCDEARAFGVYFVRNYVGSDTCPARVATPSDWAMCYRPLIFKGTSMAVTNNIVEQLHAVMKAAVRRGAFHRLSPSKFIAALANIYFEMLTLPALYFGKCDSSGRERMASRSSRRSSGTLTAMAVEDRLAIMAASGASGPVDVAVDLSGEDTAMADADQQHHASNACVDLSNEDTQARISVVPIPTMPKARAQNPGVTQVTAHRESHVAQVTQTPDITNSCVDLSTDLTQARIMVVPTPTMPKARAQNPGVTQVTAHRESHVARVTQTPDLTLPSDVAAVQRNMSSETSEVTQPHQLCVAAPTEISHSADVTQMGGEEDEEIALSCVRTGRWKQRAAWERARGIASSGSSSPSLGCLVTYRPDPSQPMIMQPSTASQVTPKETQNMVPWNSARVSQHDVLAAVIECRIVGMNHPGLNIGRGQEQTGDGLFVNLTGDAAKGESLRAFCMRLLEDPAHFELYKAKIQALLGGPLQGGKTVQAGDTPGGEAGALSAGLPLRACGLSAQDIADISPSSPAGEYFFRTWSTPAGCAAPIFLELLSRVCSYRLCVLHLQQSHGGVACHHVSTYFQGDCDVSHTRRHTPLPMGSAVVALLEGRYWRIVPRDFGDLTKVCCPVAYGSLSRSVRQRRPSLFKRGFADKQHGHIQNGTGASARRDHAEAAPSDTLEVPERGIFAESGRSKSKRSASDDPGRHLNKRHGAIRGANARSGRQGLADATTQLPRALSEEETSMEDTLFDHLAAMLVANENTDISEIGVGPYPGNISNDTGEEGNTALWIRTTQGGHVLMSAVQLPAVPSKTYSSEGAQFTVVTHESSQDGWIDRLSLGLLRNHGGIWESVSAGIQAEATPLRYDQLVNYEAETGMMYSIADSRRLNFVRVGLSVHVVEGYNTVHSSTAGSSESELLCVLRPAGAGVSLRGEGRGLSIVRDASDRVLVFELLKLIRTRQVCHRLEVLVCLSKVPTLRDMNFGLPVL